jgi:hypothetical protein
VRAADQHPHIFFLVANVVTGIMNVTIDTNHSSFIRVVGTVVVVF